MSSAEASGERGIAIGRDAIHSIFATGDHNQFFVGDYQRLADAYLHPWPVFERVQLDRFTGRGWLASQVDDFLTCHDRGVFVLEAEAGLGKTAFLAHLARERGYIHHFVELARGLDGVAPGLKSLAAQLVRAWVLNPYTAEAVLPGSAARPEFLQNLLKEAADRRDRTRPGEKIVLVVDALDEAGTPAPGQNVLRPASHSASKGVYLVVSQRPVEVSLTVEAPREVVRIEAQGPGQPGRHGGVSRAGRGMARREESPGRQPDPAGRSSSPRCSTRARGVWIYLHYVLAEIETGRRTPLTLEDLPQGLWQYYARFWNQWRRDHEDAWDARRRAAPEHAGGRPGRADLRDAQLALDGVASDPTALKRLRRVLDTEWSPYLAAASAASGSARAYRFYHASLREFFGGAIDTAHLTWTRANLRRGAGRSDDPGSCPDRRRVRPSLGRVGCRSAGPADDRPGPSGHPWTAMVCITWPRTWKPLVGRTTFIILCGWSGATIREIRRVPVSRTCGTRCTSGWATPRAT